MRNSTSRSLPFARLQLWQQAARLSAVCVPSRASGSMWSIALFSIGSQQYAHNFSAINASTISGVIEPSALDTARNQRRPSLASRSHSSLRSGRNSRCRAAERRTFARCRSRPSGVDTNRCFDSRASFRLCAARSGSALIAARLRAHFASSVACLSASLLRGTVFSLHGFSPPNIQNHSRANYPRGASRWKDPSKIMSHRCAALRLVGRPP